MHSLYYFTDYKAPERNTSRELPHAASDDRALSARLWWMNPSLLALYNQSWSKLNFTAHGDLKVNKIQSPRQPENIATTKPLASAGSGIQTAPEFKSPTITTQAVECTNDDQLGDATPLDLSQKRSDVKDLCFGQKASGLFQIHPALFLFFVFKYRCAQLNTDLAAQ